MNTQQIKRWASKVNLNTLTIDCLKSLTIRQLRALVIRINKTRGVAVINNKLAKKLGISYAKGKSKGKGKTYSDMTWLELTKVISYCIIEIFQKYILLEDMNTQWEQEQVTKGIHVTYKHNPITGEKEIYTVCIGMETEAAANKLLNYLMENNHISSGNVRQSKHNTNYPCEIKAWGLTVEIFTKLVTKSQIKEKEQLKQEASKVNKQEQNGMETKPPVLKEEEEEEEVLVVVSMEGEEKSKPKAKQINVIPMKKRTDENKEEVTGAEAFEWLQTQKRCDMIRHHDPETAQWWEEAMKAEGIVIQDGKVFRQKQVAA